METIDAFKGQYRFLSNFYEEPWPTLEHHFQAHKATTVGDAIFVMAAKTPTEAKKRGQMIKLREDWEERKIEIMHGLLVVKFKVPALRQKLLDTGDALLIEGNTWGDRFWGQVNGEGENVLGELLMIVREGL